jgi:hypothetical protein
MKPSRRTIFLSVALVAFFAFQIAMAYLLATKGQ